MCLKPIFLSLFDILVLFVLELNPNRFPPETSSGEFCVLSLCFMKVIKINRSILLYFVVEIFYLFPFYSFHLNIFAYKRTRCQCEFCVSGPNPKLWK